MSRVRRALISVSDKTGLVPFATELASRGWELVSTGGTAKALEAAGLPVVAISDVTGFPEMMDGRVKTLHPRVHAGILARRGRKEDIAALQAHDITPIDLVVVNLYPFAKAAARPDITVDALIEEIDIGGPSLVRAAAKNFHDVLVVVDPYDYPLVLTALSQDDGVPLSTRFDFARRAIAHTAAYDRMIATTLGEIQVDDAQRTLSRVASERSPLPPVLSFDAVKLRDLRYGENPHQKGGWYAARTASSDLSGFSNATVHQGKELSFTNLLDLDAAARIALEFDEAAAVVIKHTNPCGVATASNIAQAYLRARDADALSAFGGIVGLNSPIDLETAKHLTSTFIEAVIAPAVIRDDEVQAVLQSKPNMRVVTADFRPQDDDLDVRSLLGAVLVQTRDRVAEAALPWPATLQAAGVRVVSQRAPTSDEWHALRFAWRVCAHVKSNAVIFTGRDVTLAIGAGQMSRVDAVKTAVMKGSGRLEGSVAASDAFFPFRDGLDAVADAGATAVVQPGGSVRDQEVIAAADERGLAMVFTGRRHFRH